MIFKVFALPDPTTAEYFADVFQGSPIHIDLDGFGVEVGSSRVPVGAKPGLSYTAMPGVMDVWYDSTHQRSYWILPLIPSPEMAARHDEIGDAWGRSFVPFLQIAEVQNMQRRRVAWMRSIATGLADAKPILTFTNEVSTQDNAIVPSRNDFYEDYKRRMGAS